MLKPNNFFLFLISKFMDPDFFAKLSSLEAYFKIFSYKA